MSAMRDHFTDATRDGSGQLEKTDVGYELSFAPISVEEEKKRDGYVPADTPQGSRKNPPLHRMQVGSTRGSSDIGK